MPWLTSVSLSCFSVDPAKVQKLVQFGYPESYIVQQMQEMDPNYCTAGYYLLEMDQNYC